MRAARLQRRRGQGMTEYIILVGIVALLMIAAVNRFAFTVDEAIQGSANAFVLHEPAEEYYNSGNRTVSLGKCKNGEVTAVATKEGDAYVWKKMVGGREYDAATDGPITSGGHSFDQ